MHEIVFIPKMISEIGLREFPLILARGTTVSSFLGACSRKKNIDIDLFWDCFDELETGISGIFLSLMPAQFKLKQLLKRQKNFENIKKKISYTLFNQP